jgi:flagella basal body P-ring formation protein FlgA
MRLLAVLLLLPLALPAAAATTTRTLGADQLAAAILQRIELRQSVGEARLELDNPGLRVALPEGAAGVDVEGLTYDPRSGRVAAYVAAEGQTGEGIRVTGRVRHMVEVAVLARPVAAGETLAPQDVARIQIAADRLTQGFVIDPADLVGKAPRRALRPSEPVRAADLQVPALVKRNELVTITLETGSLVLTAQGKAAEEGGKGATIRVTNTKSGRVLDTVVTGPGAVAVTARN